MYVCYTADSTSYNFQLQKPECKLQFYAFMYPYMYIDAATWVSVRRKYTKYYPTDIVDCVYHELSVHLLGI